MGANTNAAMLPVAAEDVMASIDDDGSDKELVIADISCNNSWLTMPLNEAASLPDWR